MKKRKPKRKPIPDPHYFLSIYIEPWLQDELWGIARRERKNLSDIARIAIKDYLERDIEAESRSQRHRRDHTILPRLRSRA